MVRAKQKSQRNILIWTKEFENILGNYLPLPYAVFDLSDISKSADYKIVHANFKEQLVDLERRLEKKFVGISAENIVWKGNSPYNLIFEHLWGCNHTCPFCRETCQRPSKQHPKELHACIQHRPIGLKGVREEHTNIMSVETCNYCINSENAFYCGVSDLKCQSYGNCKAIGATGNKHAFRDYVNLTPDWEIEPSSIMETSTYWMWFTNRFQKELANQFDYILPDIVKSWESISKKEAINSLKRQSPFLKKFFHR